MHNTNVYIDNAAGSIIRTKKRTWQDLAGYEITEKKISSVYSEYFCAEIVFLLGTSLPSALFFFFSFFRLGEGNGNPL